MSEINRKRQEMETIHRIELDIETLNWLTSKYLLPKLDIGNIPYDSTRSKYIFKMSESNIKQLYIDLFEFEDEYDTPVPNSVFLDVMSSFTR